MQLRYEDMRGSYPVRNVRLDPYNGLENVQRHIPTDALIEKSSDLIRDVDSDIERRQTTVFEMARAVRNGRGRRTVAPLFQDQIDALCWEILDEGIIPIPRMVEIAIDAGGGPYSSPDAVEFCFRVILQATLGVSDLSELTSQTPSAFMKMFVCELLPPDQLTHPLPPDGFVGLYADQHPNGTWRSSIAYSQNDYSNPAVRANHYLSRSPEIVRVVLMGDEQDQLWAYVTRDIDFPDGGNVMRVSPDQARSLRALGLDVYPMNYTSPYDAYMKWDKSDILITDPMPLFQDNESMQQILELTNVLYVSGLIADADQWDQIVGRNYSTFGHFARGHLRQTNADYDGAIEDFTVCIGISGTALDYFRRGRAYAMKGDHIHAIKDYNFAISIDQDYVMAYLVRGESYYFTDRIDLALRDYNDAIRIAPDNAIGYLYRAELFRYTRDVEGTIDDLDSAVRICPNYESHFIDSNFAESASNLLSRARGLLTSIISAPDNPVDSRDFYLLGVRALYTNNRRTALRYFRKAEELGYSPRTKLNQHIENLQNRP